MMRGQAEYLERFQKVGGFPTRHQEEWRYVDLSFLEATSWCSPVPVTSLSFSPTLLEMPAIVLVNGFYYPTLSTVATLPGIRFSPHMVEKSLVEEPMTLWNYAYLTDGWTLTIEEGVDAGFLQVLHLTDKVLPHTAIHGMISIHLEKRAKLRVVDIYRGAGPSLCYQQINQVRVGEEAHFSYYKLQEQTGETSHFSQWTVSQAQGSQFEAYQIALGASIARDDVHVNLRGEGSQCQLQGLYLLNRHQLNDHHITVDHQAPRGESHQHYRGILEDQSEGVWNGKVLVQQSALHTKAHQLNQNWLLSKKAKMNTKPELRIDTDQVVCSHGATVGTLDQQALFYLQSRGIPKSQATFLLQQGFAQGILEVLPDTIRSILEDRVYQKLLKMAGGNS